MLAYNQMVYLIHILFVAPLLIYIGYFKDKSHTKVFDLILIIGLVVFFYHGYQFFKYRNIKIV